MYTFTSNASKNLKVKVDVQKGALRLREKDDNLDDNLRRKDDNHSLLPYGNSPR